MPKLKLGWKVLVPVAGSVLAAGYFIARDGNETTASVPAAQSVDSAPSTPAQAESPAPPTWPRLGATVTATQPPDTSMEPDQEMPAGDQDNNPQALADPDAPSEPGAQVDDSTPTPDPSEQAESSQQLGSENIAQQALNAEDPSARATAIHQLIEIGSPEALSTLGHALQDRDASNRRVAVETLRQLVSSDGDPDGQIRSLLRTAIEDPDPSVADSARNIIGELSEIWGQN